MANWWGKSGKSDRLVFFFSSLVSKITVYSDCSHEIKRCLLLGRKAMTNLDSILKSKDITLLTKVHMVQLSHLYMTSGKTIASTIWTFVSKVISLLFNMLSRFVIAFLPSSKHLLISWPQSLSRVILEFKKIKSVTASTFSPFYLQCSDGARCHDLSFLNVEF